MNRATARLVRAACACVLAACSVARAGSISEALAWAPADTDAFLALRDGAAVRTTALGGAGEDAFLGLLAGASQTRDAWGAFAETLGYTEPQAFDALLGQRFVVIARGVWSADAPAEWVVVSDIGLDVDDRIRKRFASPPREVIAGMPVFALEKGRFSLLRMRDGETARIVIAPTASAGLLKSVAVSMRRPGEDALASQPAPARIARLGDGDALGLVRFPEGIGGWWGGVARFEDRAATVEMVTTLARPMTPPAAWTLAPWESLAGGAALLFVERMMPADEATGPGLGGVFDELGAALGPVIEKGRATRTALLVESRKEAGLALAGAIEAERALSAARDVDRFMQGVVSWLGSLAGSPSAGQDFGGILPESARRVEIGKAGGAAPALGATPIVASWRLRPAAPGGEAGWWIGGTDAGARARLEVAATADEAGDGRRPWLSYGVVRPGELIGQVQSTGTPLPNAVRGVSGFASVEWWTWMERPTEMQGRMVIVASPRPGGS
ncbi:MAG: hypothetical protein ACF8QF_08870 [Phycisphaerales bacterium]